MDEPGERESRLVAALQDAPPTGLPRHTHADEADVLRRWVDDADGWAGTDLAEHLPAVTGRLRSLPEPRWVPPVVAFSIGLSGLTLGVTAGALYLARSESLRERCPDRRCAPELEGEKNAIDSIGVVSAVGLSIGAVGAAVGTVMVLVDDGDEGEGGVEVAAGLGSIVVTGRF